MAARVAFDKLSVHPVAAPTLLSDAAKQLARVKFTFLR
jgi:hypothetical protein